MDVGVDQPREKCDIAEITYRRICGQLGRATYGFDTSVVDADEATLDRTIGQPVPDAVGNEELPARQR